MSKSRYRHHARRWKARRPGRRNPGAKYASGYSHGAAVERMYRKLQRHGAGALNAKELRLLRRESDAEQRNPRRGRGERAERYPQSKAPSQRDWEGFTRIKRAMRVNPKRGRRNPVLTNPKSDGSPTRGERKAARRGTPFRSSGTMVAGAQQWDLIDKLQTAWRSGSKSAWVNALNACDRAGVAVPYTYRHAPSTRHIPHSSLYIPDRDNPKRDGTPTRGEIRKGKYATHLKTIAQRGKDAEAILARVTGVPAASKAAVKEHLPAASVAVLEAPPAKVEAAVEHAEAKFLRSRIDELTVLHKDLLEQIEQLGDDDLTVSEAEDLTEQAAKIAKQRTKLREKATGLGIQTNPRRNPGRRGGRRVLIGLHRYGAAIKHLHRAIRALR